MKTLITGGFGFLGTHLVELLLEKKPDLYIHIVDNLSSSIVDPYDFLRDIGRPERVTYDILSIDKFLARTLRPYDEIYHLASVVGPAGVLPHAGSIAQSIIDNSSAIAQAAMRWGARLVDVSTSEVYGGGTSAESDPKIITADVSARLEYAVGKLASEISLINLSKAHGLDVSIVRPFNIAGPRQSAEGGFVLPRFCEAAIKNEPLTVFGDGKQVRGFTHVKDVADGLWCAMNHGESGEVYNIGNPKNEYTIGELATRVVELADSKSEIEFVDPKDIYGSLYEEANDKLPNSYKAKTELKWQPARDLDSIITDTLEWTKQRMEK